MTPLNLEGEESKSDSQSLSDEGENHNHNEEDKEGIKLTKLMQKGKDNVIKTKFSETMEKRELFEKETKKAVDKMKGSKIDDACDTIFFGHKSKSALIRQVSAKQSQRAPSPPAKLSSSITKSNNYNTSNASPVSLHRRKVSPIS